MAFSLERRQDQHLAVVVLKVKRQKRKTEPMRKMGGLSGIRHQAARQAVRPPLGCNFNSDVRQCKQIKSYP